ncbi:MAG: bacillithiol biosynthesis deacetylase BshB1 [Planctomycetota bacterium]
MSADALPALDVLVVAAHPDDAEISVGGTILRLLAAGARVGVLDVTRGEMGTRGTQADRDAEAALATERMGLTWRGNLGLPDGRVEADVASRERLAGLLRELGPDLVLGHTLDDPHPDHVASGHLLVDAWYLSGLRRLAEEAGGAPAKRPQQHLHFVSHTPHEPLVVVDIEPVWEAKCAAVEAYASQLKPSGPDDDGKHFLFRSDILERMETKARAWGERVGCRFGEPLVGRGPMALDAPLLRWLVPDRPTRVG